MKIFIEATRINYQAQQAYIALRTYNRLKEFSNQNCLQPPSQVGSQSLYCWKGSVLVYSTFWLCGVSRALHVLRVGGRCVVYRRLNRDLCKRLVSIYFFILLVNPLDIAKKFGQIGRAIITSDATDIHIRTKSNIRTQKRCGCGCQEIEKNIKIPYEN